MLLTIFWHKIKKCIKAYYALLIIINILFMNIMMMILPDAILNTGFDIEIVCVLEIVDKVPGRLTIDSPFCGPILPKFPKFPKPNFPDFFNGVLSL